MFALRQRSDVRCVCIFGYVVFGQQMKVENMIVMCDGSVPIVWMFRGLLDDVAHTLHTLDLMFAIINRTRNWIPTLRATRSNERYRETGW